MDALGTTAKADARLLADLERAFAHWKGTEAGIDARALQAALGLRSEYLARRVLAAFDRDGDGVIAKDEFIDGVRRLIAGTDRDKLMFAFRVHDHDGDGAISREELHRMIAISLAESDVAERATQPANKLADALFIAADTNKDGGISFDELAAIVAKYPALLRKMTRSEAQWIAPNEAILARLEGGNDGTSRTPWLFENGWGPPLVLGLWIAINVALLAHGLTRGRAGTTDTAPNEMMQAGRALGRCIDWNGALLLVPVMRKTLTWLRSTLLGRVLPIDQSIAFHRIVGHTMVALGIAHGGAVLASYAIGHPHGSIEKLLLSTERGMTGVLLLVVVVVMWMFALAIVRRSRHFELFYYSHLLYVVWFALAIAHAPSFFMWAAAPLAGFAFEQVLRLSRRGVRTSLERAEALRSGVTKLEITMPPGFSWRAGDYAFLRLPAIAKREWHPFTISSAPESGALTFHVRSLGNWTAALRHHAEQAESAKDEAREPLVAYVDGPYGSPTAHIARSSFAVLIGAGIGVTPFASVLQSLVLRANGEHPPTLSKAHFFWLNRDQYSFEWFRALLAELETSDHVALLDIHLCMTAGRSGATSLGLEAARQVLHDAGRSDLITGLRTHTHMGQPNWGEMLGAIKAQHAPSTVDVYFCGPRALGAKIRDVCMRLGMPFREEQF